MPLINITKTVSDLVGVTGFSFSATATQGTSTFPLTTSYTHPNLVTSSGSSVGVPGTFTFTLNITYTYSGVDCSRTITFDECYPSLSWFTFNLGQCPDGIPTTSALVLPDINLTNVLTSVDSVNYVPAVIGSGCSSTRWVKNSPALTTNVPWWARGTYKGNVLNAKHRNGRATAFVYNYIFNTSDLSNITIQVGTTVNGTYSYSLSYLDRSSNPVNLSYTDFLSIPPTFVNKTIPRPKNNSIITVKNYIALDPDMQFQTYYEETGGCS